MSRITSQLFETFPLSLSNRSSNPFFSAIKHVINSYPLVLYAFTIGITADALGTLYFMNQYGTTEELHPLIRVFSAVYNPIIVTFATQTGKIVFALILLRYFGRRIEKLLWLCAITSFLAGTYNAFAVELYLRNIVPWLPL